MVKNELQLEQHFLYSYPEAMIYKWLSYTINICIFIFPGVTCDWKEARQPNRSS